MDIERSERLSTVGKSLTDNQIYSLDHPEYQNFARAVEEALADISSRENLRRSTAQTLVYSSSLDVDQISQLATIYPEFSLCVIPLNTGVHSYWTAHRLCANEWISSITSKYARTVVHYGGSLMSGMMQRRRDHHFEFDSADEVMVHEQHGAAVDVHRIFGDFVSVQKEYSVVLPKEEYDDYLRDRAYDLCGQPHVCTHSSEALCVDLSVTSMNPEQVALAMLQHGAELCHGFYIYHPSMLVQTSGSLGQTGVEFSRHGSNMIFEYPQGRAGVARYPMDTWARWLVSHTFSVGSLGSRKWFQLELLKHRECFMFFRLVQVASPAGPQKLTHALDRTDTEGHTLVQSWKLKAGFASDVQDDSQWEPHNFLIPERLERRVREFALQLSPQQFSRYAIKKQVRVVNNRFVLYGTTVTTAPILDPQQIEDFTTAIFSRAFAERYESSRLASEMMSALNQLAGFASLSFAERVVAVSQMYFRASSRGILSTIDRNIRDFADAIRVYCGEGSSVGRKIQINPAPTYLKLTSVANSWRNYFQQTAETHFVDRLPFGPGLQVAPTAMAGALASTVHKYATGIPSTKWTRDVVRVVTEVVDFRLRQDEDKSEFVKQVESVNVVDAASESRYHLKVEQAERAAVEVVGEFKHAEDPDPVHSLNQLYHSVLPKVAGASLEYDTFSLSLDPQDRTLAAPYLRMPTYFGLPPNPREYYRSRLTALNVPKRQNTSQELLTAVAARNLSAPSISLPQEEVVIEDVWKNFLATACVEDAVTKLAEFQSDPVALAADALADWESKAKPDVVERVVRELKDQSKTLDEMNVADYLIMLKADVKPTLSDKPVREVTAPQVIVYHEKPLSALYSSIFRVLVRRFLALLKPNFHVNLLKDSKDIGQFITANHPFSERSLKYLENDFSKFDKSQSQFAFELEFFVFRQLGMNQAMLDKWLSGHTDCSLRSVSTGLSLHVLYQRKSGDATTAFGNVILNVLSVCYAYKGTKIVWAVFMGDDSIVCAGIVNNDTEAVQVMAEIFNLTAKYYITDAPYFASNFIILDQARLQARMLPDPIKRIEKLSMHVSADDPQWRERHISFKDAMEAYIDPSSAHQLSVLVPQRYEVPDGFVRGAAHAFGTLVNSFSAFRSVWEDKPHLLQA